MGLRLPESEKGSSRGFSEREDDVIVKNLKESRARLLDHAIITTFLLMLLTEPAFLQVKEMKESATK